MYVFVYVYYNKSPCDKHVCTHYFSFIHDAVIKRIYLLSSKQTNKTSWQKQHQNLKKGTEVCCILAYVST